VNPSSVPKDGVRSFICGCCLIDPTYAAAGWQRDERFAAGRILDVEMPDAGKPESEGIELPSESIEVRNDVPA
jgi:hypothetical protein